VRDGREVRQLCADVADTMREVVEFGVDQGQRGPRVRGGGRREHFLVGGGVEICPFLLEALGFARDIQYL